MFGALSVIHSMGYRHDTCLTDSFTYHVRMRILRCDYQHLYSEFNAFCFVQCLLGPRLEHSSNLIYQKHFWDVESSMSRRRKSMSLSQCSHVTQRGFIRLWEKPQHKLKYILLAFVFSNSQIQKLLLIFISTTYSLNSQIFLNTTLCKK